MQSSFKNKNLYEITNIYKSNNIPILNKNIKYNYNYKYKNNLNNLNNLNLKYYNTKNLPIRNIKTKAYVDIDWVWQSYIIGKGITLFIIFYTSLNWIFYRRERKMIEKSKKK